LVAEPNQSQLRTTDPGRDSTCSANFMWRPDLDRSVQPLSTLTLSAILTEGADWWERLTHSFILSSPWYRCPGNGTTSANGCVRADRERPLTSRVLMAVASASPARVSGAGSDRLARGRVGSDRQAVAPTRHRTPPGTALATGSRIRSLGVVCRAAMAAESGREAGSCVPHSRRCRPHAPRRTDTAG